MVRFIAQLIAYFVGSIPFGFLIAHRVAGIDIRDQGSGNIGATNVGRVLGFRFFVLVFLLDLLKGALPVAFALAIEHRQVGTPVEAEYRYLGIVVGFAAIVGHLFPVYLGFKGGKGVATTIGVIAVLAPLSAAIGLVAFVLALLATRMVSVASLAFAFAFPIALALASRNPFSAPDAVLLGFITPISLLIVVKHLGNVGRIVQGTEPQVRLPWAKNESG